MYILNIKDSIKKMAVKILREFIYENYYKPISFTKNDNYYLLKKAKKDLVLFTNKLTTKKKYLIILKLKNTMNYL